MGGDREQQLFMRRQQQQQQPQATCFAKLLAVLELQKLLAARQTLLFYPAEKAGAGRTRARPLKGDETSIVQPNAPSAPVPRSPVGQTTRALPPLPPRPMNTATLTPPATLSVARLSAGYRGPWAGSSPCLPVHVHATPRHHEINSTRTESPADYMLNGG
jgi:hypothetical protein